MTAQNLLAGFLQGFTGARDKQLDRAQKQDLIKFQTQQYKKKLEADEQKAEALKQLTGLLTPQPNPHSQAGNAPAQPKKSLSDFMVDPELQALLLKSGQMDMGDMMKEVGMQKQRDQTAQIMQSLGIGMPGSNGPSFQGGNSPFELGGANIDPSTGKVSLSVSRKKPSEAGDQIGAVNLAAAANAVEDAVNWMTDGRASIDDPNFGDSINMAKWGEFVTQFGEGSAMNDELIRGVQTLVYLTSGKTINEAEARRTIGPLVPEMKDVTAAFSLTGKGGFAGIKQNAASKLQNLYRVIKGTMGAGEISKLLQEAGIDIASRPVDPKWKASQPSAKSSPLPERKVIRFEDLPDG